MTGADSVSSGLLSVDPELAVQLNQLTDDSTVNAVVVYHQLTSDADLATLQNIGIAGGTRFRALPMVIITGTRNQIMEISRLPRVRSIYGNRTVTLNSEPDVRAVTELNGRGLIRTSRHRYRTYPLLDGMLPS